MAQDVNRWIGIGRLTKDLGADERSFGYVANGQARANVSIAVNHSKKQSDEWITETDFFDVTIWGKQAENLKPYLLKGTQICVDGHLKQDRWEKDGQKFSKISIVADNVQLLGGKKEGGSSQPSKAPASQPSQQASFDAAEGFPEDFPF